MTNKPNKPNKINKNDIVGHFETIYGNTCYVCDGIVEDLDMAEEIPLAMVAFDRPLRHLDNDNR